MSVDITKLGVVLPTSNIGLIIERLFKGNVELVKHDMVVHALQELIDFYVSAVATPSDFSAVEATIAIFARLDAMSPLQGLES